MRELDEPIDLALQILRDSKSRDGEIYIEDHAVFSVAVAGGRIESLETQEVRGAGLRLFDAGRVAFGYTSDLSAEGLAQAVRMGEELLERCEPDESNRLPEVDESSTPEPDNYDATLARVDPHDKISMAKRVEEAALGADPRVKRVRISRYTDAVGRIAVANTGGLRRVWPFSRAYASIELNAEQDGAQQSGWHAAFSIRFSNLDPVHVGREAARRATQKLGATRISTRRANLVVDPTVAASLLEAISPALHADYVLKGKSLLGGKAGQEIASPKVTLLDDGRIAGGDHSGPYDAEGVATRCTLLIEGGVLKAFLQSSYTSLRMGAAPTGNVSRSAFTSPPRIAPSTLFLQPTGIGRDALLVEAGDALYVTEVMGLHTVDPISGDFSLGASGLMLRGGRLEEPVEQAGIAGNVLDLLRSISGVANDLTFMPGGGAGSTTLLAGLTISGT